MLSSSLSIRHLLFHFYAPGIQDVIYVSVVPLFHRQLKAEIRLLIKLFRAKTLKESLKKKKPKKMCKMPFWINC